MMGKASGILAVGMTAVLISHGAAADTLTGCLTKYGRLVKLSVGDMPARPCGKHQQQVTLNTGAPEPEDTRTVFVTSERYTGNLGGIAGGDAKCQALADAAGLGGTFQAWLSDSTSSPWADPTFYKHDGPYVRIDGVKVAQSWDDLTDGTLLAQIQVDETGVHPEGIVFTNTNEGGAAKHATPNKSCMDWTSDAGLAEDNGAIGGNVATPFQWTLGSAMECGKGEAHLYCFEQ